MFRQLMFAFIGGPTKSLPGLAAVEAAAANAREQGLWPREAHGVASGQCGAFSPNWTSIALIF